jgi:hypothetical protein
LRIDGRGRECGCENEYDRHQPAATPHEHKPSLKDTTRAKHRATNERTTYR